MQTLPIALVMPANLHVPLAVYLKPTVLLASLRTYSTITLVSAPVLRQCIQIRLIAFSVFLRATTALLLLFVLAASQLIFTMVLATMILLALLALSPILPPLHAMPVL